MSSFHILVELQSILHGQFLLDNFIDRLFEALSGESLHEAAGTAVVLNEDPL